MPSTNSRRAKRHEREVVTAAEDAGLSASRAWNSDGRSLGCTEETDVLVGGDVRVQCKRRKTLASYLTCSGADVVVTREDRGENLAVVPLSHYLDLLRAKTADEESP